MEIVLSFSSSSLQSPCRHVGLPRKNGGGGQKMHKFHQKFAESGTFIIKPSIFPACYLKAGVSFPT
jgi:hypothetical protein